MATSHERNRGVTQPGQPAQDVQHGLLHDIVDVGQHVHRATDDVVDQGQAGRHKLVDRSLVSGRRGGSCRKTVATLMDEAGLSARAADQLGHSKVSMTQDNYFGRKIRRTRAATVLENMAGPA